MYHSICLFTLSSRLFICLFLAVCRDMTEGKVPEAKSSPPSSRSCCCGFGKPCLCDQYLPFCPRVELDRLLRAHLPPEAVGPTKLALVIALASLFLFFILPFVITLLIGIIMFLTPLWVALWFVLFRFPDSFFLVVSNFVSGNEETRWAKTRVD